MSSVSPSERDARIAKLEHELLSVAVILHEDGYPTAANLTRGFVEETFALLRSSIEREAEAAKDATRLDWLGSRAFTAYRSRDGWNEKGRAVGSLNNHVTVVDEDQSARGRYGCVRDSLRAAIDEAMRNVSASLVSEEKADNRTNTTHREKSNGQEG